MRSGITSCKTLFDKLRSASGDVLASIISSLTPDDEGVRNVNIESIIWRSGASHPVDISNFFTRSRLSKLRLLDLWGGFQISSSVGLAFRTTLLTTLSICINVSPRQTPFLTILQILPILASNPNLQRLSLHRITLPDATDGPIFQVSLRSLELLFLDGVFGHLFALLRQ